MPLTDTAIRKAKPSDKPVKLTDGQGLYLLLRPDGARWWRWDYRRPVTGRRNTLSLGTYPDTGLADARAKRDEARRLLAALHQAGIGIAGAPALIVAAALALTASTAGVAARSL